MAQGLNVSVKGIEDLLKKLGNPESLTERVDMELSNIVKEINEEQVARTPVDHAMLIKGNRIDVSRSMNKRLFNEVEYSPYVEFGTGGLVNVPEGLEEIAIQFKGAGIRQVNLPARPFFFAPFFEKYKEGLEKIRKKLLPK